MSFHLEGRVIFFATNNVNKFNEARVALAEHGIAVGMLRIKSLEIQNDNLEEIAKASVLDAYKKCRLPIVAEDAGLFVDALNGFPGPYAAYVYKTIGNEGLLQLLKESRNRGARFESAVAYHSGKREQPVLFKGEIVGEIAEHATHDNPNGFGFDPIFKPAGSKKTFAQMHIREKNRYSHRAKALRSFGEWYRKLSR